MVNNNGHNPNGIGNAAVHVNGNGHKPEAAIPAEHELLWDGLSPAVTHKLDQPLDSALVSQRKGRGGKSFDYLEGHIVIAQANAIFGYGGWGYDLVGDVTLRQVETVDPQTGEVKVSLGYSAPVRVTVAGAPPRTDIGVHPVTEETFDGHDTAMKGAVTDGMKRALPQLRRPVRQRLLRRPALRQRLGSAPAGARQGPDQRQVLSGAAQGQRREVPGAAQGRAQRLPGREAAQAALRDSRRAGHRRGHSADRRGEADGQGHRRPDGWRARRAGGGRCRQAPEDEGGAGAAGRLASTKERCRLLQGGRPRFLIYRKGGKYR